MLLETTKLLGKKPHCSACLPDWEHNFRIVSTKHLAAGELMDARVLEACGPMLGNWDCCCFAACLAACSLASQIAAIVGNSLAMHNLTRIARLAVPAAASRQMFSNTAAWMRMIMVFGVSTEVTWVQKELPECWLWVASAECGRRQWLSHRCRMAKWSPAYSWPPL